MKTNDLTNQTFGRLLVVARIPKERQRSKKSEWVCICDCGAPAIARSDHLRAGFTQSCGCLHREKTIAAKSTHSLSKSREYRIWNAMRSRCTNAKHVSYPTHGGRGIRVCERWASKGCFENFIADMGPAPSNEHSIDRINPDGHYEPSNCRWATPLEQSANTRAAIRLTHNGKTQSLTEWADEIGVTKNTLYVRLQRGWTVQRALTP